MLVQERELADKRVADERRRLAGQVRQYLLTHLDRVKLEAISTRVTTRGAPHQPGEQGAAFVLIAPIEHGRILLPWDRLAGAQEFRSALDVPLFAEAIRQGERSEHLERRFDTAAGAYRRALTIATVPAQRAFAQLALARALAKAGRVQEAAGLSRALLDLSPAVVDDQGIPFGLYAMRRLLEGGALSAVDLDRAVGVLRATVTAEPTSSLALYMVGELSGRLAPLAEPGLRAAIGELQQTLHDRTRDLEQAQALQNAFPTLSTAAGASTPADPTWVPFGLLERLWLVSTMDSLDAGERVAIAVRAAPLLTAFPESGDADILSSSGTFALNLSPDGEPLGLNFPGLSLVLPPSATSALARQGSLRRTFYSGALVLVLGVALSGGYFFWRDVQRDLRLSNMRSQFVSSVSHELKTPLTAIRMFAETLRMGRSFSQTHRDEYLDTIVNESERLTRLLNNVLDFSKIEQGRKTYRLESQSLAGVVHSAARTMHYPLSQQGFDLRVDVDETLPAVAMDADALEQATLNLLSNAMKYSGHGRVIALRLAREAGHAMITVTDRGCGIALSEQAKIFEKFYRMSEHQLIPGTGLGLTLVEHTARAHGGRVVVQSAPGQGSTFSIVLPLKPAPPTAQSEVHNLRSQEI